MNGTLKKKRRQLVQSGTQSIERTLSLLRIVGEHSDCGARLSQIVRRAKLPSTTVHRILSALVDENFIEFDQTSKLYRLGIELYLLGKKARQFSLIDRYRSALESIAQKIEDTVYLVIRSGFDALCIDLVEGKFPVRILAYNIGTRKPLGIGSASLALMAFLKDKEIDIIIEANKIKYRFHENITVNKLRSLIQHSKDIGYVFSEGLYLRGVNGVGLPIYSEKGEIIAAISVGGTSDRLDRKRSKIVAKIIRSEIESVQVVM